MYENEDLMNEVMETETKEEVITNEDNYAPAAPIVPDEIYVPQNDAPTSHGPNKVLIAAAIAGGLFVANKVRKKVKPMIEKRKAKKAAEEEARIIAVLEKTGLVQPKEVPADPIVEVPEENLTEVPAEETKKEETTEEKK